MRVLIGLFLISLVVGCTSTKTDYKHYKINQENGFTGTIEVRYKDGKLKEVKQYVGGKIKNDYHTII